jgi:hypothetical protein
VGQISALNINPTGSIFVISVSMLLQTTRMRAEKVTLYQEVVPAPKM